MDVQRYLSGLGVRVPRIHAFEEAEGLMVLEDLGDEMLETRLLAGDAPEPLYERAVDQLARLRAAAEARPDGLRRLLAQLRPRPLPLGARPLPRVAARGLEGRVALRGASGRSWIASSTGSPRALDAEPKGFTHRDYQSRNLMVLPGGEQVGDRLPGRAARPAPVRPRGAPARQLRRARRPGSWRDARAATSTALAAEGGPRLEYGPFREIFDLLTVQRKLKDAGRFVFIDRVKGQPGLPASPSRPRCATCARRSRAGRTSPSCSEVLARHVPELR